MELHYQLGKYLRTKRMEAGISQSELAGLLTDVHPQFISNWERGKCAPPGHAFKKLTKLLKIDKEELMEVMLMDSRASIERKIFGKISKTGTK